MKFASGFEILEYCQNMAEKFGFYERCLFHTTVSETVWNEETARWTVKTDRGDAVTWMLTMMRKRGFKTVDVKKESEVEYTCCVRSAVIPFGPIRYIPVRLIHPFWTQTRQSMANAPSRPGERVFP